MLKYHPSGTTQFVAYDGDQFEVHNGERQIHTSGSKAERMNELLDKQMLPTVCRDSYINKKKLQVLRGGEPNGTLLVVAAVDNDATRKMCIDVLSEMPGDFLFVTPGNSTADDPDAAIKGNVLWFGRVGGEQIGIRPDLLFPNIEKPKDGIPRKGSCIEDAPSSPQLIAANALAAAYTLTVVQNFLDDRMPTQASHLFFNGRSMTLTAN
jgi:hypothetical protein